MEEGTQLRIIKAEVKMEKKTERKDDRSTERELEKQKTEKERGLRTGNKNKNVQSSQGETRKDFITVAHKRDSRNGSRVKQEKKE